MRSSNSNFLKGDFTLLPRIAILQLRPSKNKEENPTGSGSSTSTNLELNPAEIEENSGGKSSSNKQPRKRRKSLVNLLFSKSTSQDNKDEKQQQPAAAASVSKSELQLLQHQSSDGSTSTTTTTTTSLTSNSGGQKLHFRRLSEIIVRASNKTSSSQQSQQSSRPPPPSSLEVTITPSLTSTAASKNKNDSSSCFLEANHGDRKAGTTSSPSSQFLSQLFPYRRRRSSVNHMDNTKEFREIKKESIEATRRRMSSFPPSDGDESAIILEKIHYISSIQAAAASEDKTPTVSESTNISPLKLLKKNLKTSTTTIGGVADRGCIEDSSATTEDAAAGSLFLRGHVQKESKEWKSAIEIGNQQHGRHHHQPRTPTTEHMIRSEVIAAAASAKYDYLFLAPSLTYTSRRGSSPLVAELNALRVADQRDKKAQQSAAAAAAASASVDQAKQQNQQPLRPGVVVFPKRKIEDVPGIFIPKNKPATSKGYDEDLGSRITQFLGVKIEDQRNRRRHSVSDPALIQNRLINPSSAPCASQPRPIWANLQPRSPYASTQDLLPLLPR